MQAEAERAARAALEQERKEAVSAASLDFSSHSVHVDYEPGSEGKHGFTILSFSRTNPHNQSEAGRTT